MFAAAVLSSAAFAAAWTFTPGELIPLATRSGLSRIAKDYVTVNTLSNETFSTQTSDNNMYSRVSMVQGSFVAINIDISSPGDYELSFHAVGVYTSEYRITVSQASSGYERFYDREQTNRNNSQLFTQLSTKTTQLLESLPVGEVVLKLEVTKSTERNKSHFGNFALTQKSVAVTPGEAQFGDVSGELEDIIAIAAESATPSQSAVVTINEPTENVVLAPGVALKMADGIEAPETVKIYIAGEDRTAYYKPLEWVDGMLIPELDPAAVRPEIAIGEACVMEPDEMTLSVANVRAGLYYDIVCASEADGEYSELGGEAKQATADGEAITLEVALDWSDGLVRFFKIQATDVAP
ncbi:MAG: hypothetical protein II909_04795 [Kiritimatiellae bacterium]|nr:hypothetical protein [Kiritimatiellia bacterium]